MRKLSVKVVANISNAWVTTTFVWFYRNIFIAQQHIDAAREVYGDRLQVLSITELD